MPSFAFNGGEQCRHTTFGSEWTRLLRIRFSRKTRSFCDPSCVYMVQFSSLISCASTKTKKPEPAAGRIRDIFCTVGNHNFSNDTGDWMRCNTRRIAGVLVIVANKVFKICKKVVLLLKHAVNAPANLWWWHGETVLLFPQWRTATVYQTGRFWLTAAWKKISML